MKLFIQIVGLWVSYLNKKQTRRSYRTFWGALSNYPYGDKTPWDNFLRLTADKEAKFFWDGQKWIEVGEYIDDYYIDIVYA
jgi:hypothetical protein